MLPVVKNKQLEKIKCQCLQITFFSKETIAERQKFFRLFLSLKVSAPGFCPIQKSVATGLVSTQ